MIAVYVDAAERIPSLGPPPLHGGLLGGVAHHHQRAGPQALGLLGHRLRLRLVATGVDDDVGAPGGQLEHDRAPDIAARAVTSPVLPAIPKSPFILSPSPPSFPPAQ